MLGDALFLVENVEIVCNANVPTTASLLAKLLGLFEQVLLAERGRRQWISLLPRLPKPAAVLAVKS